MPFKAAGGKTYYGGPDPEAGCTPAAPETDSAERGGVPSNTTYGITGKDGKGSADFAVWTRAENGSLGCSAKVRCALVAVPVVGVSLRRLRLRVARRSAADQQGRRAADRRAEDQCGHDLPPHRRLRAGGARHHPQTRTRRCAATCGGARRTGATGSRCR
ncbi:hypothetical protein [Nocardioides convexus]|uniref:hypothetical protein n=1 Tax=Nocardioides convexus TaxID=2712224 RepID=UPI0024183913|nr:hypothetical protein [Nocardioides convexus]